MTDKIAGELVHKLDILIALTATAVLEKKTQKERIHILGRAGLPVKDIAAFVGTTRNTVSVTLTRQKKVKGKAKKAKAKE